MGGCRCSYRDCLKATGNSENFHFFHYPIKDPKRCMEWIINAQKPNFTRMSHEQLRNKVVCQLHFESSCFTNESKRRLVHNAVPTLDNTESKTEVLSVEILQSDSDVNVYTVDTSDMMVSNCPTYLIQDGDLVPAKYVANNITKLEMGANFMNTSNITGVLHNSERESIYWPHNETNNLPDPLMPISKNERTAENGSIDIVQMAKILDLHSKKISRLNHSLNRHISMNRVISRFRTKNKIFTQLRSLLPPSLYAVVSLQLSSRRANLTKEERNFVTTLYQKSPSAYKILTEDFKWKLPAIQAIHQLLNSGDGDKQ